MASSHSPSSSQEPLYLTSAAAQPTASKSGSRRLPPPCWSDEETVALIEVYRDKWYSLRRGNLRAPDWQEVADGVAARCPLGNPSKTSIQCRHKMEKLRKRYRAEIRRIGNTPKGNRYPSSWIHFNLMDSMELGTSSEPSLDPSNEDDEEEDDLMLYPKGVKPAADLPVNRRFQGSIPTGVGPGSRIGNGNGVRIKIPNFAAPTPQPPAAMYHNNRSSFDDLPPPMNPNYGSGSRNGYCKEGFGSEKGRIHGGGVKRKNEEDNGNVLNEMVAAIQKLGDGFVKMEKMKMDMAREVESMRMKAEMKRTEMILETQQKLWDSFSETVMEKKNKKMKRMATPEA
ncbi:hypothetical protein SSX86_023098 [Deinandra increscens subsp. villosa]|uniref:Myb-like domain-containing protein n=1 Tax=Deinandra increscens subsp. villosa TaxID=3103831 RepID=A0AAP0GPM0_9ASTR